MPLTAAISVSQGSDNTQFTITDTSNYGGSDPKTNISARQIILYKADGTVYRQPDQTADEIDFSFGSYPDDTITIEGLEKDLALSATMVLTPVASQSGSAYSVTSKFAVTGFTRTAFYERQKKQALQPRYEKNTQYITDNHRLLLEADSAENAAAADDIAGAQLALDRAYRITQYNQIPY